MAADGKPAGVEAARKNVGLTYVAAFVSEHPKQSFVVHPVQKLSGEVDARSARQYPDAVGFRIGMFMQGDSRAGGEGSGEPYQSCLQWVLG